MPDIVNPYIPGQPVDDPDLFFGRRDVLASIGGNLVKGRRVFVVSGPRRMGKTSVLRQVAAHLPDGWVAVRVDLLDEDAQQLDWLLWRLADAISQQLGAADLEAPWSDFEGNTGVFLDRFWPQVLTALGDDRLVLMLDDLDSLDKAGEDLLRAFLAVLDTWRDRDDHMAVVMTVAAARQEWLLRQAPRLFGGSLTYTLGSLSGEEATRLITWPVDGVLTYDYGVARRLIEVASSHPFYLQLLCFEVFNRCAPSGWVNQRDVDMVVEDLVGREIGDFRQVWEESSPREQASLAALVSLRGARGVATGQEVQTALTKAGARLERGQATAALEDLAARGILERLGALSYRFQVALLRDWLSERVDLAEVVRNTRWSDRDRGKPSGEARVIKLPVAGASRRRTEVQADQGEDAGGAEEAAARPRRRIWLWVGVVAVVLVGLLLGLRPALFPPPAAEPTSTPTLASSKTPFLLTATQTLAAVAVTDEPAVAASATTRPTPIPIATPTPTPPIVVSRPMPSIAYLSRGSGEQRWSVYVMDSDGSDRIPLIAAQAEFLSAPSWSPDGSQIAFVSDQEGNLDIWVMDRDGGNARNLTNHPEKDHSPAWSPDGEWIAFASVRDSLYWELYVMRVDGSDVQRLTWWEDASDLSPSWSPDGTRLAFASKRDGNWEIYVMDRDGGNLVRLTNHPGDDTKPAWSPDGGRIAFESTREGFTDIYVMATIGGEVTNLTNLVWATDLGPTWSPDGGRLAFYSDRDGDWDVYVMASDGSDVVKLTADTTNDQVPSWRP